MMEVIPVLDILGGKAVAGKSGRRREYRALKSVYANSPDPLEITGSLPHRRLYVADLNGIEEGEPDYSLLEELCELKRVLVDVGVRDYEDYKMAKSLDLDVVVATETLRDESMFPRMIQEGCIISIDIKDGEVLSSVFEFSSPAEAFDFFRDHGAERFIFLDISAVGTLEGNRFGFLEDIDVKDMELMVGGGIVRQDIPALEGLGVDAVLVGTALHKGLF